MTKKCAFCPPIDNPLVEATVRACVPWLLKGMFHDLRVRFRSQDLQRLKALRGERMLLLPNHPGTADPITLFELARRLGEPMHYVAAREVFAFDHGVRGWVFQRCGVYSVIRGEPDRDSFRMTRQILTRGPRRLVVFIEGEISYRNDVLIPFQPGVLQLALGAQEDVCQQWAGATPPPVYVAPIAIRYFYAPGIERALHRAIVKLEEAVGIAEDRTRPWFQRLTRVGERIVVIQEGLMRLSSQGLSMDARVTQLKNKLLEKMELFLALPQPSGQTVLDRVRAIRNRMDRILYAYTDPDSLSPYERAITQTRSRTFAEFYEDLDRVVNFMTYKEADFSAESPSERWVEMVHRLEKEVFGQQRLTHPRTAVIQVGEIQDLRTRMPAYQASRKQTVQALCAALEADMRHLLQTAQAP